MYGTVASAHVKPENRAELLKVLEQPAARQTPGFIAAYTLFENESNTAWLFAVFEDRESYDKNANDPEMDKQYQQYRALMEDDPQWHDGEITGM